MKTENMQKRLEKLFKAGKIESGKSYDLMPSDCRGDGYDIALKSRGDESGDYEVAGHLMRVICTVRVGSRNWSNGIPAGYRLDCDPVAKDDSECNNPPPVDCSAPTITYTYTLNSGEKAVVVARTGRKIGNSGFMVRTLASIAIRREDGRLVYRGHTPYWIKSTNTYASHYASGRNRADEAAYQMEYEMLEKIAEEINREQPGASKTFLLTA